MNDKLPRLLPVLAVLSACAGGAPTAFQQLVEDTAIDCQNCESWNQPQEAFRVFGNTYYVGVAGLSSILVDSGAGLVLLDGALPQSATQIAANIEALGFTLSDIKIIGLSHAHYDHAGGINALQQAGGARVVARPPARDALLRGDLMPDDPQVTSENARFPAVKAVDVVKDGEVLRLGTLAMTVIATPGHTPGGTSWTWKSCQGDRCLDVVYADSLSAVAKPPFRFQNNAAAATSIRKSAQIIARLDCDIFLAPHPFYFSMSDKLAAKAVENPFVSSECGLYAEQAVEQLEKRLAREKRE
jgi:metallo-beta-lactamase class B